METILAIHLSLCLFTLGYIIFSQSYVLTIFENLVNQVVIDCSVDSRPVQLGLCNSNVRPCIWLFHWFIVSHFWLYTISTSVVLTMLDSFGDRMFSVLLPLSSMALVV